MTIWKYPLTEQDEQYILMPSASVPLTVQIQNGIPCLWAIVHSDIGKRRVKVRIFGTGHEGVTTDMDYIGTYQTSPLVFHVFLERPY